MKQSTRERLEELGLISGLVTSAGAVYGLFSAGAREYLKNRAEEAWNGRQEILVVGCKGTGKSTLVASLERRGGLSPRDPAAEITGVEKEAAAAIDKVRFRICDTPGHWEVAKILERISTLQDQKGRPSLNRVRSIGIINVVAYGYHEYRKGEKELLTDDGQVIEEALARHRGLEISELREWAAGIPEGHAVDWVVTVINKADIWADRREAVEEHYGSGAYQQALGTQLGQVSHSAIPYSGRFHTFYQKARMSGVFDDASRSDSYAFLARKIGDLGRRPR